MRSFHLLTFGLTLSIAAAILLLTPKLEDFKGKIDDNINRLFTQEAHRYSQNIETWLATKIPQDWVAVLKKHPALYDRLSDDLMLLRTDTFKYIFLLYKDRDGNYRFLLDGSPKEERASFGEVLQVDKALWDNAWRNTKCEIVRHEDLSTISFTHLLAIRHHGHVAAIVAIDFSPGIYRTIAEALKPVETMFYYVVGAMLLLLLVIAMEAGLAWWNRRMRFQDGLTGLYNRAYLREFVNTVRPQEYAIVMCDIDFFKKINDTYGHKAGDLVLSEVAKRLKLWVRPEDRVIRFGGEEFLIFLKWHRLDEEEIAKVVERLRERIAAASFQWEEYRLRVTISCGVVFHPERYKKLSDAIKMADELLYEAKRTGRNKVVVETAVTLVPHTMDITAVSEAIAEDRIFCVFQPIVDFKSCRIVKFEALVRLRDKEGKVVMPGEFLPVIEHTSVYATMTKYVLQIAFDAIERSHVPIAVNLNVSDLGDDAIFEIIDRTVQENCSLASKLVVEILENEPFDERSLRARLECLKEYGVRIAIDDFGAGYANYALLDQAPIDIVKIDGSLIEGVETSPKKQALIDSIVSFARASGAVTVAEYVGNEKICRRLIDLGVDQGQGFYLAKPSPSLDKDRKIIC